VHHVGIFSIGVPLLGRQVRTFRRNVILEDGSRMFVPDIGVILPNYTASHYKWQSPPMESQTSNRNAYLGNKPCGPNHRDFHAL